MLTSGADKCLRSQAQGSPSIPGMGSLILGSTRLKIQIPTASRARGAQPGAALVSRTGRGRLRGGRPLHTEQRRTAGMTTRELPCLSCLPCSAGWAASFPGPVGPLLSCSHTPQKLHRGASSPLKVGPRGPLKLPRRTPALPPSHSRQALSATHRLWSQQVATFSDRLSQARHACSHPAASPPLLA